MLRITIKLFLAIIMIAEFTAPVRAQSTVSTTAGAVIIKPISILETAVLHFGTMAVMAGTGGTCVLSTSGERSQTFGVNLSSQAPVATNAAFKVYGQANTTYAITLPAVITVTETAGLTANMTIRTLVARFNATGADAVTSTLGAGGDDSFTVGGTLTVPAGQITGVYAGTFNVTVAYN